MKILILATATILLSNPLLSQTFNWEGFVNILTAEETKKEQISELLNRDDKPNKGKVRGLRLKLQEEKKVLDKYSHNYYFLKYSNNFVNSKHFDLIIISDNNEIIYLELVDRKSNRSILTRKMSKYDEFFEKVIADHV